MRKIFLITILICLSTFSIVAAASNFKPKAWQPELMIGLFKSTTMPVKIKTNLASVFISKDKKIKTIGKDSIINLSLSGGKIFINGDSIDGDIIEIRPKDERELRNMQTTINDKTYFGGLKVIAANNRFSFISIVTVESYLRAVLPNEMSPSWKTEALKSQAVAARTFALKNRKRHKNEGFDLCSENHCQKFSDIQIVDERTDKVITETFGEVLTYKGKLIEANFHTDSGGMTENAVDVWKIDYPYLRASTEIEIKTQPWQVNISISDFTKKLTANKKNVGDVQFIKVTNLEIGKITDDRSTSGRVKELTLIGTKGEIKLTGNEMRSIFNLKSTMFDIFINNDEVVIKGYGYGHGVGMSQYGANAFAEHSYSYDKILYHYYKGTDLKRLY